jgi:hypothetical protein
VSSASAPIEVLNHTQDRLGLLPGVKHPKEKPHLEEKKKKREIHQKSVLSVLLRNAQFSRRVGKAQMEIF